MDNKINQFRSITNSTLETAIHLLDACGGDLETAITCFLEQSETTVAGKDDQEPSSSKTNGVLPTNEELVRAPIAAKAGVLVEETFERSYAPVRKQRQTNSVFAKFRDFEAETKAKEASIFGSKPNESASSENSKRKTLEVLFRPPLEIMHHGDFESAKSAAVTAGRWLMVNVQKTEEFACQVLNRDVWNNPSVRELVQSNFVFWQIHNDTADGQRFQTYYRVTGYPFVCVLDPRTGELLSSLKTNDAFSFCDAVSTFLDSNQSLQSHNSSNHQSVNPTTSTIPVGASTIPKNHHSDTSAHGTKRRLMNGDSSEQSVVANGEPKSKLFRAEDEDSSSGVSTASSTTGSMSKHAQDAPGGSVQQNSEDFLSSLGAAGTRLMFRLPDGNKRYWNAPSTATVQDLLIYAQKQWHLSAGQHDFVMNFPFRLLNKEDPMRKLDELGVQKQDVIYIEDK